MVYTDVCVPISAELTGVGEVARMAGADPKDAKRSNWTITPVWKGPVRQSTKKILLIPENPLTNNLLLERASPPVGHQPTQLVAPVPSRE